MPGPARNPLKNDSRAYRSANVRGKVIELPAEGSDLPIPKVPAGREWTKEERALWRSIWSSPQATQYDDSYAPAVAAYVIYTHQIYAGTAPGWVAAEQRHLGAQLGLTPQSMQSLGWIIKE